MNTPSLFVACCLTLTALLLARATGVAQSVSNPPLEPTSPVHGVCGGEPCDAVARGLGAFFDRKLDGLQANGRACADCHMPTDQFQLSPASAEARFAFLRWRRQWDPEADDPLFRPIDADDFRVSGEAASDFSNLRENGLIRITIPLPPNIRLIDPATNAVSDETFVDVWRMVPSVNNVALTGPDSGSSIWPRDPNPAGGYQLDARLGTLQEQALGALVNHAQIQQFAAPRLLDDLASFQRVLFTNSRVRALADAVRTRAPELPDPDPPLNRPGTGGQGGVRARLRPLSWRPGAVDAGVSDQPVQRHLQPVPEAGRCRVAPAIRVRPVSAEAGPERADLRDNALGADTGTDRSPSGRHESTSYELRSGPRAAHRLRRRTGPAGRLG